MQNFTRSALVAIAAMGLTAPAFAAQIPAGTASISDLSQPDVNYSVTPSTVNFVDDTKEIGATGGFATAKNKYGTLNGQLSFSSTVGDILAQTVGGFFTFDDGRGGNFIFSVDSVKTTAYSVAADSQSFGLYLLGSTIETNSNPIYNMDSTATSLTLTLNQTGDSGFSASATLSSPPSGAVPEPASWAMMLGGFGMLGGVLRRKRSNAIVTFG